VDTSCANTGTPQDKRLDLGGFRGLEAVKIKSIKMRVINNLDIEVKSI
jgi:hypothetical protein